MDRDVIGGEMGLNRIKNSGWIFKLKDKKGYALVWIDVDLYGFVLE